MSFGTLIKSLRQRQGWSLDEAADAIGVSHAHIYFLEQDKHIPKLSILGNISRAYHFRIDKLAQLLESTHKKRTTKKGEK